MAIIYVAQATGSDANTGTAPATAKATIGGGVAVSAAGDTVEVDAGTYSEAVVIPSGHSGLTIRAKTGQRPVVDGGGTRTEGFHLGYSNVNRVSVIGFEIRNFTGRGIAFAGTQSVANSHVFTDNYIHHITGTGTEQFGIRLDYGGACQVRRNEIAHIGQGGEAMGIRGERCFDNVYDSNEIYMVRKSGIRPRVEKNPTITNNIIYCCWVGVDLECVVGGLTANNILAWNQNNLIVKHTNDTLTAMGTWGTPITCLIRHNTFYAGSHCSVNLGSSSGTTARYVDIQNNLFAGVPFNAHLWHGNLELASAVIDNNVYNGDSTTRCYHTTYSNSAVNYKTLAEMQVSPGWDVNGVAMNADADIPGEAAFDFNYANTSLIASYGVDLGAPYFAQVGARGLAAPRRPWTRLVQTAVSKDFEPLRGITQLYDNRWITEFVTTEGFPQSTISDLGSARTISHFIWLPYGHAISSNAKGLKLETSDDAATWIERWAGDIADWGGADYHAELPSPVNARYIRFSATSNFGSGTQTGWSDVIVGNLYDAAAPPPIGGDGGGTGGGGGGIDPPPPAPGPGGTPATPIGMYWGIPLK